MSAPTLLTVYGALILLASLVGGWIPLFVRLTHKRMQVAITFVSGVMLGVGLLHLLPHAMLALDTVDALAQWTLAGVLTMFFVQRFFDFHHHDALDDEPDPSIEPRPLNTMHGHDHSGHAHAHVRSGHAMVERPHGSHRHSWLGAIVGMTLHGLVDGTALAAGVENDLRHGHAGFLAGFAAFAVIVLHKPFDSLTLATLMAAGQRKMVWRHIVNAWFALTIPLGVLLFHVGLGRVGMEVETVLGYALAFAAGNFLCVALSDLLPEVHFHQHDRLALSTALILGLLVAWAIGLAEGKHHGKRPMTAVRWSVNNSRLHEGASS